MMAVVLILTDAQALWLDDLLSKGMDCFFENNPRERKLCDNTSARIEDAMHKAGFICPENRHCKYCAEHYPKKQRKNAKI